VSKRGKRDSRFQVSVLKFRKEDAEKDRRGEGRGDAQIVSSKRDGKCWRTHEDMTAVSKLRPQAPARQSSRSPG
jgi:hypothetical protein